MLAVVTAMPLLASRARASDPRVKTMTASAAEATIWNSDSSPIDWKASRVMPTGGFEGWDKGAM